MKMSNEELAKSVDSAMTVAACDGFCDDAEALVQAAARLRAIDGLIEALTEIYEVRSDNERDTAADALSAYRKATGEE